MLHFVTCLLLTFAPPIIMFRTTLSDESALKPCVLAGGAYIATQIIKIFAIATCLPLESEEVEHFSYFNELTKCVLNVVELVGVHTALQKIPSLGKFTQHGLRVQAVGLGWSLSESLAKYLVPLWMGARGLEFSWEYIQMGVEANINLLFNMAFIGAAWLWSRNDLEVGAVPVSCAVIAIFVAMPSVMHFLRLVVGLSAWNAQLVRFGVGLCTGLLIKAFISRYTTHKRK